MDRLLPLKKYRYYEKDKFNFCTFCFTILAIGQAPDKINYQGVLRDANGNVVANKSISGSIVISGGSSNYTFSILQEVQLIVMVCSILKLVLLTTE